MSDINQKQDALLAAGQTGTQPVIGLREKFRNEELAALITGLEAEFRIMELPRLINEYRKTENLPEIPISPKLTQVALNHILDLNKYYDPNDNVCSFHSWSNHDTWVGCCYPWQDPPVESMQCMWNKPKEIANYSGRGYEIAFYSGGPATPQEALDSWKQDPPHNDVILNKGIWSGLQWKAIGAAVSGNYACAWFGEQTD